MQRTLTLATNGCDRATAYHMSNKIIRRGEELFVTWLDSEYKNIIAVVNPADAAVESQVVVGQGFDNHCGAAMAMTPDEVLHVMNGSHHRGFVYRSSADPGREESWSPPEAAGVRPTYPSLVSDLDGNLHLTYRYSDDHRRWGTGWSKKEGKEPWRGASVLSEAPAPLYIYPTNSLSVAPNGTIHLIIEWYKVYPNGVAPARSRAVSHYENVDGAWCYTNGTTVKAFPIRIEDSDPVVYKSDSNLRPGNMAVLPDGRPCFGIWDQVSNTVLLAVRSADRSWNVTDLSPAIDALCPGTYFNGPPQIAATPGAELFMVLPRTAAREWGHVSSQLYVFSIAPDSGEILRNETIPKTDADEPDWLPSIEKGVLGRYSDDPYLIYTSGRRGEGLINEARCKVCLVRLT